LAAVFCVFVLGVLVRMQVHRSVAMPMLVFVMHVLVCVFVRDSARMLVFVGVLAARNCRCHSICIQ